MAKTDSKLLTVTKALYFNRSGVVLLFAVLLAGVLALAAQGRTANERDILIAISTGLFASALLAFLQTLFTSLQFEAVIRQTIENAIENKIKDVLLESAQEHREFLPSQVYPGAKTPDKRFNQDLMNDLRKSARYVFRGVTGRYTVARLWLERCSFDEVHILVGNPQIPRGMESRISHIISYLEPESVFVDVQKKQLDAIYETIVAARLVSAKCRCVTVHLLNEPQVDRVELFDNAMYLTLYSDSPETGTRFPKTVRFDSTSILYKIYSTQLSRSRDTAAESLVLKPSTSDEELCEILIKLGKASDVYVLRKYEIQFKTFANQFRDDIA